MVLCFTWVQPLSLALPLSSFMILLLTQCMSQLMEKALTRLYVEFPSPTLKNVRCLLGLGLLELKYLPFDIQFHKRSPTPTPTPTHPPTPTHTQIDIWKREKARESLHCDPEELATLMEEEKELAERKLKAAVTGRSSTARCAPARGLLNPVIPCYSTIGP